MFVIIHYACQLILSLVSTNTTVAQLALQLQIGLSLCVALRLAVHTDEVGRLVLAQPRRDDHVGAGRLDVLLHLVVQLRLARWVADSFYGCGWRLIYAVLPDRRQYLGSDPLLEGFGFLLPASEDEAIETWFVDKYNVFLVCLKGSPGETIVLHRLK